MLLVIIALSILFILSASVDENIFFTCFSARIIHLEQNLFLEKIAIQTFRKNATAKVAFLMKFVVFVFCSIPFEYQMP